MLNYQLHCFNRKVITTKIPQDLDVHTPSKPKWCNLLQPEICNCTETGWLYWRKLNMQTVQKPITCKWQSPHVSYLSCCWVVMKSFYLTSCIVEWCPHILSKNSCCRVVPTSFIPQIMLMGCADIILSDNSCCWLCRHFIWQTVEWCLHHFIPQIMLMRCDDIILWQFASKFILLFCGMAGSKMFPAIPMCHQSAPTCWQFNVLQLTK
jgi:hypothetical protein